MKEKRMNEIPFKAINGWHMFFVYIMLLAITGICYWQGAVHKNVPLIVAAVVLTIVDVIWLIGFFVVNPNVVDHEDHLHRAHSAFRLNFASKIV